MDTAPVRLEQQKLNAVTQPRLTKVVVNCSIGEGGAKLEKAAQILESLVGQKPEVRKARQTIKGFGIHRGEPISLRVTLRKKRAEEFLTKALKAVNNTLRPSSFGPNGTVSFGIKEHLDITGTTYRPDLGVIGMDIAVHITRPGYRVALRRRRRSAIGARQIVTASEAISFMKERFGVSAEGEE